MIIKSDWPEERVAHLRQLHSEGNRPRQIAEIMCVSRNAIIGKLARLGLSSKVATQQQPISKPKPKTDGRFENLPARRGPPTGNEPDWWMVFADTNTCRWPIGDPRQADFRYCDSDRIVGSYCAYHATVARYRHQVSRVLAQPSTPGGPPDIDVEKSASD